MAKYGGTVLKSDRKWQAEADERTLSEAALIAADTARLRYAMSCMKKKQHGVDKLVRAFGRSGRRGRY